MLANDTGEHSVADDPEGISVFVIGLFHRSADEPGGVVDSGAVVQPWKPFTQITTIPVDQIGKYPRIVLRYLAQFNRLIDSQFQPGHPRSIRAYTDCMKVGMLQDRIRQREDQLFLVLTLVIGAIVGLTIVAFIIVAERV